MVGVKPYYSHPRCFHGVGHRTLRAAERCANQGREGYNENVYLVTPDGTTIGRRLLK